MEGEPCCIVCTATTSKVSRMSRNCLKKASTPYFASFVTKWFSSFRLSSSPFMQQWAASHSLQSINLRGAFTKGVKLF